MSAKEDRAYILGIDVGTTSVKATIIDQRTKKVLQTEARQTSADITNDSDQLYSEQDPRRICTALQHAVSLLKKDLMCRVVRIGVCGQMHGVVLWKAEEAWKRNAFGRYEIENCSVLYTWQDGRCSKEFLSNLPTADSHLRLSTGHGCATLFWLIKNCQNLLKKYDRAGTIHDLVVSMLCGLNKPVMSVQNAASWGYFNTVKQTWNKNILCSSGFPVHLLPEVRDTDHIAGTLSEEWYGIPGGTAVKVALGDMQCGVIPALHGDQEAVLNISTSAQLSFIMPKGFHPPTKQSASAIEYFPYFHGRYLAVAASLNGGNVMASFVRMLQQWTHSLGLGVPEERIWETVLSLAAETDISESDLVIFPTVFGERHAPDKKASVLNVNSQNLGLGKVFRSLCAGIIANLHSMMSREVLIKSGITRIVGSGSAFLRNKVLQAELTSQYRLPIVLDDQRAMDAATGAALNAAL